MIKSTLKIARYCPLVIQGFSNFLGLFQGIMANSENGCRIIFLRMCLAAWTHGTSIFFRTSDITGSPRGAWLRYGHGASTVTWGDGGDGIRMSSNGGMVNWHALGCQFGTLWMEGMWEGKCFFFGWMLNFRVCEFFLLPALTPPCCFYQILCCCWKSDLLFAWD